MKKAIKLILTAVFAMTFCLSLFMTVNTQQVKADGESYTLAFEMKAPTHDFAASPAGWWTNGNNPVLTHNADGTTTMEVDSTVSGENPVYYYVGNFEATAVTAGKTYIINMSVKCDNVFLNFQVADPWSLISGAWSNSHEDFYDVSYKYTATETKNIAFYFQFNVGGGKYTIKNFTITEVETKTLTAGAAIGELPEVPAKEGYNGYWTIDGVAITAETVYNYGADKIAKPAYKENTFKLSFENDFGDLSKSTDGWWGTTPKITADGAVMERKGENVNYFVGLNDATSVVSGKNYLVHISIKCDNMYVNFAVNNPWCVFSAKWICNNDFVSYTYNYTAETTGKIDFIFQLNAADENGAQYIVKDFYLTEIVSTTEGLKKGDKIGTLPEVPEKTGYTGYWMIGDEKLTAGTVYNYEESKTAKLVYEANKYTLTLGETEIEVTYGKAIGTLPAVPEKTGHTGYWTVNDVEITAKTVYYETENVTAVLKYEANKYTLTLGKTTKQVTYGEAIGELPAIETEARNGYEYAWFIGETRLNEETVWEYTENKAATATETLIQYKIEFKIGDTIVKTVYYTVETEEIEEPAILPREGYTAKWEDYTLDGGDKVVNAVYTEIQPDSSSSSGSETSGSEISGSEDGDSCFGGINGLPMLGALLMAAAFVTIIRRKKNA